MDPARLEAEDVVHESQVIGGVRLLDPRHLVGHRLRAPHRVALAVDRLRTPVAVVGAAAGGDEVQGEVALRLHPEAPVAVDVHEIQGRPRQRLEVPKRRACARAVHPSAGKRQGKAGDVAHLPGRARQQKGRDLAERDLALPQDHGVRPRGQVDLRVIARVGARDHDGDRPGPSHRDHLQRALPHPRQAHLGEVVEAVLEEDGHARTVAVEIPRPLGRRRGEHRVEEGHVVPPLPQHRRGVERAEGRVRLLRGLELGVKAQEVALADEHVAQGSAPAVAASKALRSSGRWSWRWSLSRDGSSTTPSAPRAFLPR